MNQPSPNSSNRLSIFKNKKFWSWIKFGIEVLVIVGLIIHVIPTPFEEKLNTTGIIFAISLGVILLINIIISGINYFKYSNVVQLKDSKIEELISEREKLESRLTDISGEHRTECQKLLQHNQYVELFPKLNQLFSNIQGVRRDAEKETDSSTNYKQQFESEFKQFCTTLSDSFSELKSTYCHVSLKYVVYVNGRFNKRRIGVITVARDGLNRNHVIRTDVDRAGISHFVDENSDYDILTLKAQATYERFFICNDLVAFRNYENSSFYHHYKHNHFPHPNASYLEKENSWPLPYRSCITAVITDRLNYGTLVGYLTIDANQKDVFSAELDAEILSGCADGLYDLLNAYIKKYVISQSQQKSTRVSNRQKQS